jgi:GTP cyclohydrolase I/GTP cyclohydrolase-4
MKRSDEVEVVERAHMHPRFVEDCVREMARMAIDEFGGFEDGTFLLARQENLETIHRHSVVAERHGLIGELRHELADEVHVERHVTMREWLEGPAAHGR